MPVSGVGGRSPISKLKGWIPDHDLVVSGMTNIEVFTSIRRYLDTLGATPPLVPGLRSASRSFMRWLVSGVT